MFVTKDFVRDCFVAQLRAKMCMRAGIRAYLREEATPSKILGYEHWNYPKGRLKLKLDIVEKLTDSPKNRRGTILAKVHLCRKEDKTKRDAQCHGKRHNF